MHDMKIAAYLSTSYLASRSHNSHDEKNITRTPAARATMLHVFASHCYHGRSVFL